MNKSNQQANLIEYSTGGGVVVDQGRVLLLERPSRQEIRLPKGHIEEGETAEAAGLRETSEEAGYSDLQIDHDLGYKLVEFDYKEHHYRRTEHYFLMSLHSNQKIIRPPRDEADFNVMWLPLELAVTALTYPAEQAVVQQVIERLKDKAILQK